VLNANKIMAAHKAHRAAQGAADAHADAAADVALEAKAALPGATSTAGCQSR
jgi:hypothetical protein